MSVNKVFLIGNVGQDPQIRQVGDQKVASFNLATTEKFKGRDGNMVESTEWHNISVWGKLAEVVEKFVSKGTQLYVEGRIKTEKYTKDGQDKFIVKIYASTLQLLGKRDGQQTSAPTPAPAPHTAQQRVQSVHIPPAGEPNDGDLPF